MSINLSRYRKAPSSFGDHIIRDCDSSSTTIVGSSHLEHVFGVSFFKSKKRDEKFAHFGKKVTSEFNTVERSSWRRSFCNNFDSSEDVEERVNERFVNTLNLKFDHVLILTFCIQLLSFRKEKAAISIDQTSNINKIIPSYFRLIKKLSSLTHANLDLAFSGRVQNGQFNIHRDRLSERTPKGDAIVGPAQKCAEKGITRPSATP